MGFTFFVLYAQISIPSLTFECNNDVLLFFGQQNTKFWKLSSVIFLRFWQYEPYLLKNFVVIKNA